MRETKLKVARLGVDRALGRGEAGGEKGPLYGEQTEQSHTESSGTAFPHCHGGFMPPGPSLLLKSRGAPGTLISFPESLTTFKMLHNLLTYYLLFVLCN